MRVFAPEQSGNARGASNETPRLLCILAIPRTGTNHLCSILSKIPEIEVRYEIFHPIRSYSMRSDELIELSRLTGEQFDPSPNSPAAVDVLRRNPELALQCILRLMKPQRRLLAFKVFAHHLSAEAVESSFLMRSDTTVIIVRRRPIDTYISHMKALATGNWSQTDTTDVKIDIDAEDFLSWWQRAADWYHKLEFACRKHGRSTHHLTYESDIDVGPAHLARRVIAILTGEGVNCLTMPNEDRLEGLLRQDRTEDVEQRVANWADFHRRLSAVGAMHKAFDLIPRFTAERPDESVS